MTAEAPAGAASGWRGGIGQGLAYGALGLPLAFVALPLYVILPNYYASEFGIPLAALGALLLGARLLDAVADPWIGRLTDGWFAHSGRRVIVAAVIAAVVVAIGFRALFFPMVTGTASLLAWCGAFLAVTYLSYSVLSVLHQAWGARLGGDEGQRARIVSWREGLALAGVLVASVLPSVTSMSVSTATFALTLALGVALLTRAPQPRVGDGAPAPPLMFEPLRTPAFRRLQPVADEEQHQRRGHRAGHAVDQEHGQQAPSFEPLFLASYFAAGALSMPLWVRLVARFGLERSWLVGMLLAVAAFIWALGLGAGDVVGFALVCIASGIALGADLTLPGAMLAGVIQRAGHGERLEGAYFGWWNFATKLNLALAAGIALPLLALFGYTPGARDPSALSALSIAYCLLPCVLKLTAVALLHFLWLRPPAGPTPALPETVR
jgi:GPH family glycoside/pentoside/hexuronide:cation symporter